MTLTIQLVGSPTTRSTSLDTPIEVGLVGTSFQESGETPPDYNTPYLIHSVSDAESRFGTGSVAALGGEGSIVSSMRVIESFGYNIPVRAVALRHTDQTNTAFAINASGLRTNIDAAIAAVPNGVAYFAAPGWTVNYDASGAPLATVCPTIAAMAQRANIIRAQAFADGDWSSLSDYLSWLGEAGNIANRVMPVGPRLRASGNALRYASAFAMAGRVAQETDVGAQEQFDNIPILGIVRQETPILRDVLDSTSGVPRVRAVGGSTIAWSGHDWRIYGGSTGAPARRTTTPIDPRVFLAGQRVVDIYEQLIQVALEKYEGQNLKEETPSSIMRDADTVGERLRSSGLIARASVSRDNEYNTPANLGARNYGIQSVLEIYTPLSNLNVRVPLVAFIPAA